MPDDDDDVIVGILPTVDGDSDEGGVIDPDDLDDVDFPDEESEDPLLEGGDDEEDEEEEEYFGDESGFE